MFPVPTPGYTTPPSQGRRQLSRNRRRRPAGGAAVFAAVVLGELMGELVRPYVHTTALRLAPATGGYCELLSGHAEVKINRLGGADFLRA